MNLLPRFLRRRPSTPEVAISVPLAVPKTGRSSVEETGALASLVGTALRSFGTLSPVLPWEFLEYLQSMALVNADVSQAVGNVVALGNPGHEVVIEGASRRLAGRAVDELNTLARTLYRRSAGVDGLIAAYLRQLAVSGAISSEDVLTPRLDGVADVAVVPVLAIRFRYEYGAYIAYQKTAQGGGADGLIPLNEETYRYYAAELIEGSPYAKPPMAGAVETLLAQKDARDNLAFVVKKLGLLGLVSMTLTPPPRNPGETDGEYRTRLETYAGQVAKALEDNYAKGLLVKYSDQTLEHHPITGEARGAKDVFQMLEEQVASGLQTDPAMLGRSYSTTETYAGVVYHVLTQRVLAYQRLAKRRCERTYRLHLRLAGYPELSVNLQFNRIPALDPEKKTTADKTQVETVLLKVERGLISPDEGAQELGYDSAWDPALMTQAPALAAALLPRPRRAAAVRLTWNRRDQRYHYRAESIHLPAERRSARRVALVLGEDEAAKARAAQQVLERQARRYLDAVLPLAEPARQQAIDAYLAWAKGRDFGDFDDAETFAQAAYGVIAGPYAAGLAAAGLEAAVQEQVGALYRFFRLDDTSAFEPEKVPATFRFGGADQRATAWFERIDTHYFSRYVDNETMQQPIKGWFRQNFLDENAGLFGRGDPGLLADFQVRFAEQLDGAAEHEIRRIIDTTVARAKNWANIRQLAEHGWERLVIQAVMDAKTSAICREMDGRVISVQAATAEIDRLTRLTPAQFAKTLKVQRPHDVRGVSSTKLIANARGWPPFHPNCRTTVRGYLESSRIPEHPADAPQNAAQERSAGYWDDLTPYGRDRRLKTIADNAEYDRAKFAQRYPGEWDQKGARAEAIVARPDRIHVRLGRDRSLRFAYSQRAGDGWDTAQIDMDRNGGVFIDDLTEGSSLAELESSGFLGVTP